MNTIDEILSLLTQMQAEIDNLRVPGVPRWIYLTTPLTSASWDGDAYSTTAKTLIDLSAVFGVPAYVKAILAVIQITDIDSTGPDDNFLILSPNNVAGSGPKVASKGRYDNDPECQELTVPCDANGDCYYQIAASGVNSLTAKIQIFGYYI